MLYAHELALTARMYRRVLLFIVAHNKQAEGPTLVVVAATSDNARGL
jgi:hypothetical protein